MIEPIKTKEEFKNVMERLEKSLIEQENNLTNLEELLDRKLTEPSLPETDLNEFPIPESMEGINNFLRIYATLKSDVNHTKSAGTSFNLSAEEKAKLDDLKGRSDKLQLISTRIYLKNKKGKIKVNATLEMSVTKINAKEFPSAFFEIPAPYDRIERSEKDKKD